MPSEPDSPIAKFAVSALIELFKESIKGVTKLSDYLSREAEKHDMLGNVARAYTSHLAERFNTVKVIGMQSPIALERIYTKVRVLDRLQKAQTWTGKDTSETPNANVRYGIDVINETQRVAILGRPGAGKTTFLRHILLEALSGRLRKPAIPIFIVLNDISAQQHSIFAAMVARFSECELIDPELFVTTLLRKGSCIVLLDGLDEVSASIRPNVIREINKLSDTYPACQFIVSCRVAAYNYWFEKFSDFKVADFSDDDIGYFVNQWFLTRPDLASRCLTELRSTPSIYGLASLPLLLTMMCLVFESTGALASNRAELYETATSILLTKWDISRGVYREESFRELTPARKHIMLSELAVTFFQNNEYWFRTERVSDLMFRYLQKINGELDPVKVLDTIEQQHHGILVERARGVHSFSHLSFQEYFTAVYIKNARSSTQEGLVANYCYDPRWREVIILVATLLADASDFMLSLLRKLVSLGVWDTYLKGLESSVGSTNTSGQLIEPISNLRQPNRSGLDIPSLEKVAQSVVLRRESLDINGQLRRLGTKALAEFILREAGRQRIHGVRLSKIYEGAKEAGNRKAQMFAIALVVSCKKIISFSPGMWAIVRQATAPGMEYSERFFDASWKKFLIDTVGKNVCIQLTEILPTVNAVDLICHATNKHVPLQELTIHDNKDEYVKILTETIRYLAESLELQITLDAVRAFQRDVTREIDKFTVDSDTRHGWKATYLAGVIVDIMMNQAPIRPDVRGAALCTLMH